MSSFKKAAKSCQRRHEERHQPESRNNFGLLEKKKDYKLRARAFHLKQNKLKAFQRKILNKNPDEFYFHMINSEIKNGYHYEKEKKEEYTDAQLKLMQTQDIGYINMKRNMEAKKVEKLKANLHLMKSEERPKNSHTFFVDSALEAKKFDIATHLQTHPSMLERPFNRLRVDSLKKAVIRGKDYCNDVSKQIHQQYQELSKRIEREQELNILSQKMIAKKNIANKKEQKRKVKEGTKTTPPIYLWKKERKR